ncbi:hypothetical protein BJX61DRAFT_540811 [Aspergillus egyptiacus]|nr:hypothetical protein BJX61DRAFT_540811 [Aspergillus egyptiacus]
MEHQIFQKIPQLQVIICRHCQHGVRPAEVEQHLKQKHQLGHADTHAIATHVQQWEDIEQDSQAIQIPTILEKPLPVIPCQPNGLRCTRVDPPCSYLATSIETMRKHWQACMSWQQVFPSKQGSHYIYIRFPDGRPPPPAPTTQIQQAVDAMCTAWQEQQERQQQERVIQAGEINDANPWLRMTRWAEYLQGVDPSDLLAISTVANPEEWSTAVKRDLEAVVQVLQQTMAQLVRKSQQTVQHCSHAIRIEAVRTETSQTPYQPLMAYMNPDQIQKHVQPWQQVLGFIARTQAGWPWKARKPEYGMTARQRRYWQRLRGLAEAAVDKQARVRVSPDPMETDEPEAAAAEWQMTALETTCLEFCIELLNQRYHTHEYKSPLVCAMAVLGQSKKGWRFKGFFFRVRV